MFQRDIGHPANYIFGAIERRPIRQLRERHEISLILCGNKSCGHAREAENSKPNQTGVDHNGNRTGAQRVRYELSIAARCAAKEPVKQLEKPAEYEINRPRKTILLRPVSFQEQRSQSRTQRERVKR